MTMYILRVFPDEHKWWAESATVGYFTNKKTLWAAIVSHADDLGLYGKEDAEKAFWGQSPSYVSNWLDTGDVELCELNVCYE